ncbi:MAG: lysylphosphatidylglycerol synthase transmembrane domain-containing protein [Pseudomonadota bacterium]|nr:lysylphosphatidylglycerol synthase transmembrane domain-containing protein [Pseudomonadota bacterium]
MKQLVVGVIISAILVFFSLRGIDYRGLMRGFEDIAPGYAGAALAIMFLMQAIRSLRWGVILSPIHRVGQFDLFAVTNVGFLAIVSLPARIGEFARPFLIARKTPIKMSSALATIFIERIFDSLTVFLIFAVTMTMTPLPAWLIRSSALFILLTLVILGVTIFMLFKRERCLRMLAPLINRLPARYAARADRLLHQFIDGFGMMARPRLLIQTGALSLLFWLVDGLAIYMMFKAFHFTLPFIAAFVVLVILMIGIAIPAGPGFVGNWHFFCILALTLYGVPKTEALSFAIVYHFLSVGIVILLGLLFLPANRFSLSDLRNLAREGN